MLVLVLILMMVRMTLFMNSPSQLILIVWLLEMLRGAKRSSVAQGEDVWLKRILSNLKRGCVTLRDSCSCCVVAGLEERLQDSEVPHVCGRMYLQMMIWLIEPMQSWFWKSWFQIHHLLEIFWTPWLVLITIRRYYYLIFLTLVKIWHWNCFLLLF